MDAIKPKTQVRVRPDTWLRLDRIARAKGWKLAEAIDRAVTALEQKSRRRSA